MFDHIAAYYDHRLGQFEWKYYIRHEIIRQLKLVLADMGTYTFVPEDHR